ncbi:pyridoxamine 5'-phosphate oxidase family protein [Streptomyces sp. NPDC006307]|uniref:pyridoxamine 5'-phosphate oxidase family protein n=1 Tax=Streptomyces sp. NPDC006307 TaxID=3156748 RepID=UPI00339F8715
MPLTDEPLAVELLGRMPYGRIATSLRALPAVAPARHIVSGDGEDREVLLRMDRRLGYHHACHGTVVAYGADNFNSGADVLWSVQFTGTARLADPTPRELALLGAAPDHLDPVYLRVRPGFVSVHTPHAA